MNPELLDLAATMFGEEAQGNEEVLRMVGSSVLNRRDAGRVKEWGSTIPEITQMGYYAKQNQNDPYRAAISGQFNNKEDENRFKRALQIASGLLDGSIERVGGEFFFTDDEMVSQREKGFNFDEVEHLRKVGPYNILQYSRGEGKPVVFEDDDNPATTKGLKSVISKSSVKKYQKKLSEMGYDLGEIDGIAGKKTKAAVKKFQKDAGLEVDGIVGRKTKAALGLK